MGVREEKSREAWRVSQEAQPATITDQLGNEGYMHHPNLHRWQSEESVLATGDHHRATHNFYPYHAEYKHMSTPDRQSNNGTPPPPIPARGANSRPPLPPKPMQLYHATPTHIEEDNLPNKFYENYEHLQLEMQPAKQPRTLRVIHNQLKGPSFRRGSLDSMMDNLESFQNYSSSSSTESHDGSDLLSSLTTTFDQKLKLLVDPKYCTDSQGNQRLKTNSDSSSVSSSAWSHRDPVSHQPYNSVSDQSRESLLSILSNKENMHGCESFSSNQDFEPGYSGSASSLGSLPHRHEAKIGIASRIERKDIKPLVYAPVYNSAVTRVVNATGSVISNNQSNVGDLNSEEDKDYANNNAIDYDGAPYKHRKISEEKKRIRRRHTVGAADFNNSLVSHKQTDASPLTPQESLSAWQRLQPGGGIEPLGFKGWIAKERCRASSPELHSHVTPNIMHIHKADQSLVNSLLGSHM